MFGNASSSSPGKWDGDTTRYVNAMTVRPPKWRINAIDKVVRSLKETGIWQKTTWLSLLAGHDAQATLLNLVNPMQTLTAVNNPDFIVNEGWQGVPANNAYLEGPLWSGLNPSDKCFHFCYIVGGTDDNSSNAIPAYGGGNYVRPRITSNRISGRINNNPVLATSNNVANSIIGLTLMSRNDNEVKFYKNSDLVSTVSSSFEQSFGSNLTIFRNSTVYSDFNISVFGTGSDVLTDQQVEDLYTITQQYQIDIARYTELGKINASCVYDVDATISASYPGTGSIWSNLCAAPADGQTQSSYNFVNRSPTMYTFSGTANDPAAYWDLTSSSGSRRFDVQTLPALGAPAQSPRSDVNQEWTIIAVTKNLPTNTSNIVQIYKNGQSRVILQSDGTLNRVSHRQFGDNNISTNFNGDQVIDRSKDQIVAISWNSATNQRTIRMISDGVRITQRSTLSFGTATENKTWLLLFLSNSADVRVDWRAYASSYFNKDLSDEEFMQVVNEYERRHNRSYS